MKQIQPIAFFCLFAFTGFTQPVRIIGTAPGAEGKTIQLITYTDLLTFTERTVARSKIDTGGRFLLEYDAKTTCYGSLAIDFHRMEMFLEAGRTYYLTIARIDYNDYKEINPFIRSQNLEVSFQQYDASELNFLIQQFNILYNNFLLENFNALYRDRDRSKLDTLRVKVVTSFPDARNSYFNAYVKYKMAALEQLCQSLSQVQIGKKYFADLPVLYQNVEYMDFFNLYFTKYLTATSRDLKYTDYQSILSGSSPYDAIMKALGKDSLLRKVQLRELVLLKGLMEMYRDTIYPDEAITSLIGQLAGKTAYPENRETALSILAFLTKLKPGSKTPDFILKDRSGKDVSLTEFKGKPLLLNFWTTYCQGCTSEMDLEKSLFDKYGGEMNFVSVSADKDPSKLWFFVDLKKNYTWKFLHIGEEVDILKAYDVRIYPLYVLIDGDGKIFRYPAANPSAGLSAEIEILLGRK